MVDSVYGKGWGVAASALLLALIHRSAQKRRSANFAGEVFFSEVRVVRAFSSPPNDPLRSARDNRNRRKREIAEKHRGGEADGKF
jgi:hypothetical protein